MDHYRALAINDMQDISGGNAAGNAVIGGLGGLKTGIKFCKIPHSVLKGVCIAGFTALGACLAYKAN
ncbi:TPA: bacteriocin [Streptococcus equi subsp. zooepidemicus]|nr:bacteriocin [Streptococcus equi subsp. zooepidemicus]HEL1192015.1 bacteriocin [Streptococcus equi subsp. zooepidemicus]